MKRQEKMIFNFLALCVALLIITGCTVKSKEQMKQEKMNVSSSTKEDAETVTQKQVNFLKKHESEITNYIKSNDPEVVRFEYDWDSVKVGDSGAFTESGFDIRLKVYGANDKEINGYSFFIVPKPNVENPISIDSISGSNFP
ncbi:MAG: hypothetical protein KHX87_02715 [Streptococcus parasanguinis]|uniref:Lipoprotein n=1 Tax=Streptococcus parasanguinis TaxID=1318 RepID=A0A943HMR4_STRPA|nr:hypothetical protein [Streptococcus parasanguinis]